MRDDKIQERAQGRWKGILLALGLDQKTLSGRQGPCPICGGKTRFRFDDKEARGTFICNHCGAGDGFDLVMKWRGADFAEARRLIEPLVDAAPVIAPRAERAADELSVASMALWQAASPLDGQDIASRYLKARGIDLPSWPVYLRWTPRLKHIANSDGQTTHWPALLARFIAPDNSASIIERCWLCEPGEKAPVDPPRKMMAGRVPEGGAVRLFAPAETMGIAEGKETALKAALINRIPVWAALTAGALIKWRPPDICKHVIIFGDLDASFTGQVSAYSLAHRLRAERIGPKGEERPRFETIEVRFTQFHDRGESEDWGDLEAPRPARAAPLEEEWIAKLRRAA